MKRALLLFVLLFDLLAPPGANAQTGQVSGQVGPGVLAQARMISGAAVSFAMAAP
jgi:hypothetical protein